jgi:hypothetical protein
MQVELEMIGKPNRWVVDQASVRIGRSATCDVPLPARQYPAVSAIHAELQTTDGTVRVAPRDASQGELLLNGEPAQAGDVVLSGDILRLGVSGPELRVNYAEEPASASAYIPTRVINVAEAAGYEATRLMDVPSRTVESPAHSATPPPRREVPLPAPPPPPQTLRPGAGGLGAFAEKRDRWPGPSKPAAAIPPPAPAIVPPAQTLQDPALLARIRNLQRMQWASLAVIVVLGFLVLQLRSEVSTSHDDIRALRSQDQNAVAQLTPSLDARLNLFGQRMDAMDTMFKDSEQRMEKGMDEKMKVAQEQLFTSLDARMKVTEDHMVNRMNTELPPLLDKYVNAKLLEIKH